MSGGASPIAIGGTWSVPSLNDLVSAAMVGRCSVNVASGGQQCNQSSAIAYTSLAWLASEQNLTIPRGFLDSAESQTESGARLVRGSATGARSERIGNASKLEFKIDAPAFNSGRARRAGSFHSAGT